MDRERKRRKIEFLSQTIQLVKELVAPSPVVRMLPDIAALLAADESKRRQPQRSRFWEEDCVQKGERFFRETFRMSRKSFDKLCGMLPELDKTETACGSVVSLEKRVAIALYALGSVEHIAVIGNLFDVDRTVVSKILNEFAAEVWRCLNATYMPAFSLTPETVDRLVKGFEPLGLPQCIGAIDCCHIRARRVITDDDYLNSEGWESVVLMALVDHKKRFRYVDADSPGRRRDSTIYESSRLKSILKSGMHTKSLSLQGVEVTPFVVGDAAFRLTEYLMQPFPSPTANRDQETFNKSLLQCHQVAAQAFDELKIRFWRVESGLENYDQSAPQIIRACCVLHNFLIANDDPIRRSWWDPHKRHFSDLPQPEQCRRASHDPNAERIRQALAVHLASQAQRLD